MAASSLVSSSSRSLQVRMRPDLKVVQQTWQGREYQVIKDPLSLKFYRFEEEEFALLRMLDGKASADEVRAEFAARFAPQKISNRELFQFIGQLHRSSLLISDAPGQASQLLHRADQTAKAEKRAKWTNILAIRFRGFDPDALLTFLNRHVGWVFSTPFVIASCLFILSAIGLIATNFEKFSERLPAFQEFFATSNWMWLGVILALTKVLHEFGHGMACKRFGAQCHRMGIMFLVLMPCLYCDVSDSWTLKSKWRRSAIAVAGMYFEFLLASLCAFIWWFSEPGLINMLALNVVFVCSISTVLFNANPLLKYDGYYVLSDMIEVPNLRQKASNVLKRTASHWMLGIESPPDPFMPKQRLWMFVMYSILAVVYRWFITLSIFWFLYRLLEPYGLKLIGQGIAMMALWGLLGMPLLQLYRYFSTPGRISTVKPVRFGVVTGIMAAVLAAVMFIPVPHYVRCTFIIQHHGAANVYVELPGQIDSIHIEPADTVEPGDSLLTLSNQELLAGVAQLRGEEQVALQKYYTTKQLLNYEQSAEQDLQTRLVSWQAAIGQFEKRQKELDQLTVKAPIAGHVVTAGYVAEPKEDDGQLPKWFGHPLELRNQGAWLDEGTIVCTIVPDKNRLEAILAIDQADIEFVSSGNQVELWMRQLPNQLLEANIDLISPTEMEAVPKALSSQFGGSLMTIRDESGHDVPQSATYQVRVPLSAEGTIIAAGSTGYARIRTGNQTIGRRLWRFACKTFRFDL